MKTSHGIGRYKADARQCVIEAAKDIADPKLIFFFSGEDHFPEYAEILHEMYPDAVSIGCTTYRSMNAECSEKNVLSLMAVESDIICSGGVIEKADNFAMGSADNVRKCLDEVGITENTVCVEFTVPFKRAEEFALMALNSVLLRNDIPIVGGSAANAHSDELSSTEAYVAVNGKVYTDGCVFAIIHSESGKIHIYRENIYEPITGNKLCVTKANNVTRTIMKFDRIPASKAYADELGVPEEEVSKYFFNYPMGRYDGDEIFITAPHEKGSGHSLKFFARVYEGTEMMVLKEGDYKAITRKTVEAVKREVPNSSLVLGMNCIARTMLFEMNNYIYDYHRLLADAFPNIIAFSVLGEQMGTKHFNNTLLLVVFE